MIYTNWIIIEIQVYDKIGIGLKVLLKGFNWNFKVEFGIKSEICQNWIILSCLKYNFEIYWIWSNLNWYFEHGLEAILN